MDELNRRDIDRDAQRHRPGRGVAAGPLQRPVAQRLDLVDFFGDRNELGRWNEAFVRMLPAHQRLEARNLVGGNVDDRLVMHRHLVLDECVPQVLLDLAAMIGSVLQIARVEPVFAASAALRAVEREIGGLDDLLGIETVIRRDRHADRSTDDRAQAVDRIGLREHLDQLTAQIPQHAAIVDIGQHDLELVAPDAADIAHVADHLLQPRRELLEQFVARRVAQRIVDLLEAVEIEHHQCAALLGIAIGFKRLVEPHLHTATVGQTRQRIELRHALGIALLFATGGDVLGTAAVTGEFAGIIVLRLAGDLPERGIPCPGYRHRQFGDGIARAEQESEGTPLALLGAIGIGGEQFGQRRTEDVLGRPAMRFAGRMRQIGQTAIGVGCPEPAEPGLFKGIEQFEPARGLVVPEGNGLPHRTRPVVRSCIARYAREKTAHGHVPRPPDLHAAGREPLLSPMGLAGNS